MKFQIGDKVVVKRTGEEAVVTEILADSMVMLDANGISFPAYMDELEYPYFKWFSGSKKPETHQTKKFIEDIPREKKKIEKREADGLWFTFLPVSFFDEFGDEIVESLKVHLVNRTEEAYHFDYVVEEGGRSTFRLKSDIQPFEDFYLHDIPYENVNDSPLLSLECSLIKKDKKKRPYYEVFYKMKPRQVFQRIEEMRRKGDALFSHHLFGVFPEKQEEELLPLPEKRTAISIHDLQSIRQQLEPARQVVDLHIEVLEPDHENMSPAEMLHLQLRTFERYLDLAKLHRQKQFIVIHGIGSGKLRDAIHEILRQDAMISGFFNRYHPLYGYGATEILIK